jgi:nicotinate-nucleotide adenylyltransferase
MTTALFFGSFNPVHEGHLGIARHVLDEGYCREVWFVVSPCSPFKAGQELLPGPARLAIVEAALAGDPRTRACDVELSMPLPSYTARTLERLDALHPGRAFQLLVGGDNLLRFHEWVDHEAIARRYPLLVYPRPGCPLPDRPYPPATMLHPPLFPHSSTAIREKIARGEDVSRLVPAAALPLVERYYRPAGRQG